MIHRSQNRSIPVGVGGLTSAELADCKRDGMAHRMVCETSTIGIGRVNTTEWSAVWGRTSCTANGIAISFPRGPYAIELLDTGHRTVASCGSALLVNPATWFRRDVAYRSHLVNDYLAFAEDLVAEVIRPWDPSVEERPGSPFLAREVPLDAATFRTQRLLMAYVLAADPPDPLVVEEVGICILRRVVEAIYERRGVGPKPKRKTTASAHRTAVSDAQEFILSNLSGSLRLAEIAGAAGVAPAHFCGIFKQHAGRSVHEWVREQRLRTAYDRLPDYRGNFTQLALDLGFSNGNHFSSSFRGHFGEPPSAVDEGVLRSDPEVILGALTSVVGAQTRMC